MNSVARTRHCRATDLDSEVPCLPLNLTVVAVVSTEVVGVVDTEWRLRVCPAGADVCSIEAASDPQEEPKVIKERLLKNRFLGLKLAVVPLPSF